MMTLTGFISVSNVISAFKRRDWLSNSVLDTTQLVALNFFGALTYFILIRTICVLAAVIPLAVHHPRQILALKNVVFTVMAIGVYAVF